MDQELIRQRELFKKRALAQPTVEKRKLKTSSELDKPSKKPKPAPKVKESSSSASFDYKTAQGSSQYKFGILAKIVNFMKKRHQDADFYPLSLDEILDETNQLDIGNKNKHWLATEALPNNQKLVQSEEDGEKKYVYKPKYNIRDRKALLNLLKRNDLNGSGGVLMDDVDESLPNAAAAISKLGDNIVTVTRPNDKKKILFYNDKDSTFKVDEEFTKLWRDSNLIFGMHVYLMELPILSGERSRSSFKVKGVSVEGQDEKKIEEYLEKQGITSLQDMGLKKVMPSQKRKKNAGNRRFKKHNDHLAGVLQDYGELKASKADK
ncbi:general transcription factor IIE subunit 2-like isoform X1 [Dreissena polymorpha]|uniref:general transcription factor IIE subunit 2-like isoform X1 n=1 Tax=Dreissena polymorpha TaxID=45954 RepID=UPI002263ADF8|nr:general transcription factor IIE subunit 2-like isoform X1 [Dreissena polymorpha]